eukprot:TRINITY_DN105432_c0_g1_i1.p1 TRINITY_DN105432_c0_g1~~TRINITY_DN105432_c0_g1_i1.p1  ORF type:complete len:445 (-),score=42.83 TRINITY_DN105432_c0_g1_i1:69-1352(-)
MHAMLGVTTVLGSYSLLASGGLATCTDADKVAKAVVCEMDHAIVGLGHGWGNYTLFSNAMGRFWADDFIYTPAHGINQTVGLQNWYYGEWLIWFRAFPAGIFNQMLFLGDDVNASSMTYSIGIWERALGPLAPTGQVTRVRIMDAYAVRRGRITHNWMMLDMLDLLRQSGRNPLPVSPLPQGNDFPPMAMYGLPAPISTFVNDKDTHASRHVVMAVVSAEWTGDSDAMIHWSESMLWYGPVPFGMAQGKAEFRTYFLKPLHNAFVDRQISFDMMTCEGHFCAAHGQFTGVHVGPWLGYEATNKKLQLDFGMHWHVEDEQVVESWAMFDLPKLFLQIGVDLLQESTPSRSWGLAKAPKTVDGASIRQTSIQTIQVSGQKQLGETLDSIHKLIVHMLVACMPPLAIAALFFTFKRCQHHDSELGSPFLA